MAHDDESHHDDPIKMVMRDEGFDVGYRSPGLHHGGGHGGGPVTVVMGGMPIGHLEYDDDTGEWRYESGGAEERFITVRPPRREPGAEPEPLPKFGATCSAWQHETEGGVWYGPARDTAAEAEADAAQHEHAEAYVELLT